MAAVSRTAAYVAMYRALETLEREPVYLTEDAVLQVLSEVAERAPGSTIVFTYAHRGVLDRPADFVGGPRIVANVKELGEPWTFGLRPE